MYRSCDKDSEFQCVSHECIPLEKRCDGWPDCPDASDENPKDCRQAPASTCPAGQWQCPNNVCINNSSLCDGVTDCVDSSDEIACSECIGWDRLVPRFL